MDLKILTVGLPDATGTYEDERVTNLIEEMGFVDTEFEEKSIGPVNP